MSLSVGELRNWVFSVSNSYKNNNYRIELQRQFACHLPSHYVVKWNRANFKSNHMESLLSQFESHGVKIESHRVSNHDLNRIAIWFCPSCTDTMTAHMEPGHRVTGSPGQKSDPVPSPCDSMTDSQVTYIRHSTVYSSFDSFVCMQFVTQHLIAIATGQSDRVDGSCQLWLGNSQVWRHSWWISRRVTSCVYL